jgi:hypothetical protein
MAESTAGLGFQNREVGSDGQFGFIELVIGLMGLAVGVFLVVKHVFILLCLQDAPIVVRMLAPSCILILSFLCVAIGFRGLLGLKNKVLLPRRGTALVKEYDKAKLKRWNNRILILMSPFFIWGIFADLKKWDWAIGLVLAIPFVAIYLILAVWSRRSEMFCFAAFGAALCVWMYRSGGGLEQSMWLAVWLGAGSAAAGALRVWRFAHDNPLSIPTAGTSA